MSEGGNRRGQQQEQQQYTEHTIYGCNGRNVPSRNNIFIFYHYYYYYYSLTHLFFLLQID